MVSQLLMGSSGDGVNSGYNHGEGKEYVKLCKDLLYKAKPWPETEMLIRDPLICAITRVLHGEMLRQLRLNGIASQGIYK